MMKYLLLSILMCLSGLASHGQSRREVRRYNEVGFVRYSDFNAKGDGKTDDINAIIATHEFANLHGLSVKADDGATYYIGGQDLTATIQTDTYFGTAAFIIDDTEVGNRNAPVFIVTSSMQAYVPEGLATLRKNQDKIDISLPGPCLITVTDSNIKRYIRYGANQNKGSSQTDIFFVDEKGRVDSDTPIIWDFDQITKITAIPIDESGLKITGGRFTTIANQAESKYTYYSRNITIRRSNVIVDGLLHLIEGEGDHGAPYGGFITIRDCANVRVQNTILTGHKTYRTIGSAGRTVSMGSYDISVNRAMNVSFVNCSQTNDINDRTYWGIIGSNFCKNLIYDNCTFSRFDAHMGVANATIRNSELGYMGVNAIGTGVFKVENCTIRGGSMINLRSDYGSTWQGEFIIRDCTFIPSNGKQANASLINGHYTGLHDFGYTCYMPERITIENLYIDDSNHSGNYQGPSIFSDFNPQMVDDSYEEKFPYVKTKEVVLKNIKSASGMKLRMSKNPFMFKDVEVTGDGVEYLNTQSFLELENDTLHLKLDLSRGGAIAYLSKSGSKRNLINIHDEGRYVQQSYYAGRSIDRQNDGQNPGWSPWGWNPIQVGDSYNNRAEVLISKKEGNTVYVKCIPMLWDMNNSPAEATMEQWTTLEGNYLKVKNRLVCKRTDTIYEDVKTNSQELPAVYPISALDKLYCYMGDSPFTGAPLRNLEVEHLEDGFWGRYQEGRITENWMAFVDENKFGMAVYTPICNNFLAGMSGKPGGETDNISTSYIAPVKSIKMHKNTVFEYTYYLLIGDLNEMRSTIYELEAGSKGVK